MGSLAKERNGRACVQFRSDSKSFWQGASYLRRWHGALSGVKKVGFSANLEALQCSKLKALVHNLFSHYLLFDRKSEVYDVRGSGALSGGASVTFEGRRRMAKSKARVLASDRNADGMRFALHGEDVAD
jgi:hypothetical protein